MDNISELVVLFNTWKQKRFPNEEFIFDAFSVINLIHPIKENKSLQRVLIISNTVCRHYAIDKLTTSRDQESREARWLFIWFARKYTRLSLKQIGKQFDWSYDHSTIIYCLQTLPNDLKQDEDLRERYNLIAADLQQVFAKVKN